MSYYVNGHKVISINSENPNYYSWGRNCKILGFDESTTLNCLETEENMTSEDFDSFCEGYYSELI